ncbi:MAG: fatty acid desaturase [Alphaproteobacteria bacterium]|nr:fatty acid desaturase [Alphaproteobacteria bacterium]
MRRAAAAFARPQPWRSVGQLFTAFGPFLVGCAVMYLLMPRCSWLALALAVPTGALLLRVFVIQHDCGHGSFFSSRRANRIVGWLCSLCTFTPYRNWARQHAQHHARWNDLDRRQGGADIYSACLTVREYRALPRRRRLIYRLARHPAIAHLLLPPFIFLLLYRVPFDTPRAWAAERRSVHFTNAALVSLFAGLVLLLGWQPVLLVHLPVMIVASILGVWLFALQHRFETARWATGDDWRFVEASLAGSSWLRLPRSLHWLTGNIGYHHIHHLDPRVPNYRLRSAHDAVGALNAVPPLSVRGGLAAIVLTLWDEERGRLVRFRDAGDSGTGQSTGGCGAIRDAVVAKAAGLSAAGPSTSRRDLHVSVPPLRLA